jgi:hypothetical protein
MDISSDILSRTWPGSSAPGSVCSCTANGMRRRLRRPPVA